MIFVSLVYQFIWSTKDDAPLLNAEARYRLAEFLTQQLGKHKIRVIAAGAGVEHVHALVDMRVSQSVQDIADNMKRTSAQWLIEQRLVEPSFQWQEEYSVRSEDAVSTPGMLRLIEDQERYHRTVSFGAELDRLFVNDAPDPTMGFCLN